MTLDLTTIPAAERKALIILGRKYGSTLTLDQANATLTALETHAAKLVEHGFGEDDEKELTEARDALIAAGVGRQTKRSGKRTNTVTYSDTMVKAQHVRLSARSVLGNGRRVLARMEGEPAAAAVRSIDVLLDQGSAAPDDPEKMATQLDQLKDTLLVAAVANAVEKRGGPKAITDLTAQAAALRAASKSTTVPRGTPVETERLDLIDGIIITLVRSARDAAETASKALGEPSLLAEFELAKLYDSGSAKAKPADEGDDDDDDARDEDAKDADAKDAKEAKGADVKDAKNADAKATDAQDTGAKNAKDADAKNAKDADAKDASAASGAASPAKPAIGGADGRANGQAPKGAETT